MLWLTGIKAVIVPSDFGERHPGIAGLQGVLELA